MAAISHLILNLKIIQNWIIKTSGGGTPPLEPGQISNFAGNGLTTFGGSTITVMSNSPILDGQMVTFENIDISTFEGQSHVTF